LDHIQQIQELVIKYNSVAPNIVNKKPRYKIIEGKIIGVLPHARIFEAIFPNGSSIIGSLNCNKEIPLDVNLKLKIRFFLNNQDTLYVLDDFEK
jgi:hypothetical protein